GGGAPTAARDHVGAAEAGSLNDSRSALALPLCTRSCHSYSFSLIRVADSRRIALLAPVLKHPARAHRALPPTIIELKVGGDRLRHHAAPRTMPDPVSAVVVLQRHFHFDPRIGAGCRRVVRWRRKRFQEIKEARLRLVFDFTQTL